MTVIMTTNFCEVWHKLVETITLDILCVVWHKLVKTINQANF